MGEILNETIGLHREHDWPDRVVVDERYHAFLEAVKLSLAQALAKIEQIEFVAIDKGDDAGMA